MQIGPTTMINDKIRNGINLKNYSHQNSSQSRQTMEDKRYTGDNF